MKSWICVTNICVPNRKQTASFSIVSLLLAIAPLWLMLAVVVSVHGQTSTTDTSPDWTQFHRNNMQRWNPYETVVGVNNVGDLKLKWQNPLGGNAQGSDSEPAVVNGVVYFVSQATATDFKLTLTLYALNASTGAKLWSFTTGGELITSPAVANGAVYFGSDGGTVYALNASTGAQLWSYATGVPVATSPAVANGVVYVGSNDDERGEKDFFALNASTGALLWSSEGVGPPTSFSSPAVANGVVYTAAADALDRSYDLYAANASTGALLWTFQKGSEFADEGPFGAPAVANGVVYIGSEGIYVPEPGFVPIPGNLYALNASTGALLWSYKTGNIGGAPAVANGIVYAGSANGMYALNASTGALLWSRTSQYGADSPAVANGVVYFSSGDGSVYALNSNTGAELWSYDIGAPGASTPIIVDGVAYFRGLDGLYAFSVGAVSTGADLVLRLQPSLTTVHEGDLLTYTFPVWNLGPDDAVHEVLTTQVPYATAFDYIRISGTPGLGTCTTPAYGDTGPIVCHENSSMAPNTTWTVRLTVKVTAPAGAFFSQDGTVTEDTFDPKLANNTAAMDTTVEPAQSADLFLRIQPAPTTVAQGDLITYAFPVWNLGPDDAVHEVLTTQVPEGTTFDYIRISGTPGLGTCTTPPYQGTGAIVCHENASMAPNTTWTVRLTVKVTAPSGTVITENAATMADTPDPNMANNTATVSTKVQ